MLLEDGFDFRRRYAVAFMFDGIYGAVDKMQVADCEVSYIEREYQGKSLPGLVDKDFVTQALNAEKVEECDRYVML